MPEPERHCGLLQQGGAARSLQLRPGRVHTCSSSLLLHGVQPPESHGEAGAGWPKWGLLISVSPISLHWLDFKKEGVVVRCAREVPISVLSSQVRSSELPGWTEGR